MEIKENFNLRSYNTFDIECRCASFMTSDRAEDFLRYAQTNPYRPEKTLMLGGGSNLLFTKDYAGIVLHPTMEEMEIVREAGDDVWVRVGAGIVWDDFVAWSCAQGLGGVENLSYIPGRVGASPVQNVGAYGMEAGQAIAEVEAIDLQHAEKATVSGAECRFAYRNSMFKQVPGRYLVTYVTYRLSRAPQLRLDYGSIRNELQRMDTEPSPRTVREAVIAIRKGKLPEVHEAPSAGSFFKNPVVDKDFAYSLKKQHPDMPLYDVDGNLCKLAAGWLIEQCGWKGKSLGHAAVHAKQALVLINTGGAKGEEIVHLADEIRHSVASRFNVKLECEVNIL